MPTFETNQITTAADLRAAAEGWDDVWARSHVTMPTMRAELIAQWLDRFAPAMQFRAVTVTENGRMVAALPIVQKKVGRLVNAGGLSGNKWSPCGELLLDPDTDTIQAMDSLVASFDDLPWSLLWFDSVIIQRPQWQALLQAINRAGLSYQYHERFRVGLIEVGNDWQKYRKTWSKNHRQGMKRSIRRLEEMGELRLRIHSQIAPAEVEELLWRGFKVEDRSWKGAAGTSVIRAATMPEFYSRQAEQLARWNQLELVFLELNGQPIAFEYGWNAKGVYHSFKVGYDEEFAQFSPGQILMYYQLESFHQDSVHRAIDCLGPISEAVRRWRPTTYGVGRLVIAPRRLLGRALVCGYKNVWSPIRRWREAPRPSRNTEKKTNPATPQKRPGSRVPK